MGRRSARDLYDDSRDTLPFVVIIAALCGIIGGCVVGWF